MSKSVKIHIVSIAIFYLSQIQGSLALAGEAMALANEGSQPVATKRTDKMQMFYHDEDINKVIEDYSKATGARFVVDSGVRGKITILINEEISLDEAYHQLSLALATNGYSITSLDDTKLVRNTRNGQRDLVEVTTEVPSLKPERLVTWIYTSKNLPAALIFHLFRNSISRDGELMVLNKTNQLMYSDWSSNVIKMSKVFKEIDRPIDAHSARLAEAGQKIEREMALNRHENSKTGSNSKDPGVTAGHN